MAATATETARTVISDALRKIGVVALNMPMTAEQADHGLRALNRMLKAWQNKGYQVFATSSQSVTLTTSAVYTLDPVRPLQILSCRFKQGQIERPMVAMTRDEYDTLPIKTTQGAPTMFYYDRQREAARLYVWPVMASVAGETLEITQIREAEDMTLGSAVDIPGEWYDAAVYGLAARLADDYVIQAPTVIARAEKELADALAFDRDGSIWFHDAQG